MGRVQFSASDPVPVRVGAKARGLRAQGRSADIIRAFRWSATPLGPLETWDAQLLSSLSLILESNFPMFLTWGAENHLLYNDAFETALVGKGDCIGRPIRTVFPEAWPQVRWFLAEALEGRSTYIEDLPVALVRNYTLASTWWSVSYSPARADDGAIAGVLGVLYETTRRIVAEDSLRFSEAALLAVTEMTPSLLWRCDLDGRLTWANQQLLDYFGLSAVADTFWDDHVDPRDVDAGAWSQHPDLLIDRPQERQQRLRGADGLPRWFSVRSSPVLSTSGELAGWCGSATDINEWRAAADGLSEREDLMRRFSESDQTLMWVGAVATRRIEALNPDSRKAWGLPEDGGGMVWEDWLAFAHPDDRHQLSNLFDTAATGEVAQMRFRSVSKTGAVRRFHATGFAIPNGDDGAERVGGLIVEVPSNEDPRIYLVDADPTSQVAMAQALTRKGFRVRTFEDAAEFQKISGDLAPGCAVLVVHGEIDQTLKTAAILRASRRLPWIAIGDLQGRLHDVVQLMKLGAADILTSPEPDDVAAAGHAALAVAFGKVDESRAPANAMQKIAQLTQRERQVFDGLVAGGTNKTIAKALDLSPRTVETHRAHLMDRLGIGTLAELVSLAAECRGGSRG